MEMNNAERQIFTATIRNLEDTLKAACEINAELRESVNYLGNENDELKREVLDIWERLRIRAKSARNLRGEKRALENEGRQYRYELIQKSEEIERFKEESRKDNKCISKLYRQSETRRDIIALLKRKVSRLEKKLATWKYVAAEWENIAHAYKRESADRYAEIRSLKSQLENARNEIATTDEIPVSEICEVPFDENTNFVYGYAPCGNGCEVKKTIDGRYIDAHDITCEDNPEYVGIWLD